MPRFFDDYSNTYLTHDSAAGRKQQRRGWKFRENFKLHYEKKLEEWRAGPMGLAAAQQAFLRSRGPGAAGPLPPGWKEELDEATGIHYYVHEKSKRRTWVRPGFRPPPVGPMGGMMPPPMGMGGPPPHGGFRPPPGNMHRHPPHNVTNGTLPPPPPPFDASGAPPPPPWGANAPPPPFPGPPPGVAGPPPPFPSAGPPPGAHPSQAGQ